MRIYLDDERNPKVEKFDYISRDYDRFIKLIDDLNYFDASISYISFDHDLGIGNNGYDCAKFLVNYDIKHKVLSKDFKFNVHSANPIGAKNIQCYLDNYLRSRSSTG